MASIKVDGGSLEEVALEFSTSSVFDSISVVVWWDVDVWMCSERRVLSYITFVCKRPHRPDNYSDKSCQHRVITTTRPIIFLRKVLLKTLTKEVDIEFFLWFSFCFFPTHTHTNTKIIDQPTNQPGEYECFAFVYLSVIVLVPVSASGSMYFLFLF